MLLIGAYEGRSALSKMIKWETRSHISHVSVIHVPDVVWDDVEQAIKWNLFEPMLEKITVYEAWGNWKHPRKHSQVYKRSGISDGHTPGTLIHMLRLRDCVHICEKTAIRYLEQSVGKPYDWGGLFRFLFRKDKGDAEAYFCSELAMRAFAAGGVELQARVSPNVVSPGDVFKSPLLVPFCYVTTKEGSE